VIRWRSWHRWSALSLLAYIYLAVTVAVHRSSHAGPEIGLIPLTIPELVRLLRGTVIPPPRRDKTPSPALVTMAAPPPIPRSPIPSALERLRRHHTMITTIYSRRI